jgi:pimeloyl-ACP methyl ester carboxylesterase
MASDTTSPTAAPTLEQAPATTAPTTTAFTDSLVTGTIGEDESIRPFRFEATDAALADLRARVAGTIFPERELVNDSTQGVQLATMEKLARHWATQYDWRTCEARLNSYPQFLTEIDGLDIHFLHVRSRHENALPIIVTHGWPGSVVEQIKIIDPLVDPTAHGGTEADAFHVVIPSMPGYGFSGKPTATGWGPDRIATAWTTLMKRLGYDRYVAQGGDWGALITQLMAVQAPPELAGIHTNMPGAIPPEIQAALPSHVAPSGLTPDEQRAFEQVDYFYTHGLAYANEMGARPQTLYGIADSPIGLAAWFLDHDLKSYELIARVFDDVPEGLSKDDVLDNITITWLTNTGVSGARLYWENKHAFFNPLGINIPVAVSAYPDELYQCPQSWAERAFPNLIHYNRLPKGCHFAAWEQPGYFADELRNGLRSLR